MTRSPNTPEQILVFTRAGLPQLSIRRHDLDREEIVDCEAMFTSEPTLPTAKGQPRDARRRDGADRSGEAEMLGCAVEFGPDHSGFRAHHPRSRVNVDGLHWRQVDHQTAFGYRFAGDIVSSIFHGNEVAMVPCKLH